MYHPNSKAHFQSNIIENMQRQIFYVNILLFNKLLFMLHKKKKKMRTVDQHKNNANEKKTQIVKKKYGYSVFV